MQWEGYFEYWPVSGRVLGKSKASVGGLDRAGGYEVAFVKLAARI